MAKKESSKVSVQGPSTDTPARNTRTRSNPLEAEDQDDTTTTEGQISANSNPNPHPSQSTGQRTERHHPQQKSNPSRQSNLRIDDGRSGETTAPGCKRGRGERQNRERERVCYGSSPTNRTLAFTPRDSHTQSAMQGRTREIPTMPSAGTEDCRR